MAGPGDPPAFQLRAPQPLAKQGRRLALQRVALPGYEHRSSQSIAIRERQVKRIRCSIGQAADSRFRFRHSSDFSFCQSPQNVLPRYYAFGASNGLMGFNGVSNVEAPRYPSAHYVNRFISARISSRILLWHVLISILVRTASKPTEHSTHTDFGAEAIRLREPLDSSVTWKSAQDVISGNGRFATTARTSERPSKGGYIQPNLLSLETQASAAAVL